MKLNAQLRRFIFTNINEVDLSTEKQIKNEIITLCADHAVVRILQ